MRGKIDPMGTNIALGFTITLNIFTIIVIATIIYLRKRIKLVIILFKEAGKAATSMPLLLVGPVLVRIHHI